MQAVFIPPRFCCSKKTNDYPDHQHIYTQPFFSTVFYILYEFEKSFERKSNRSLKFYYLGGDRNQWMFLVRISGEGKG